MLSYPDGKGRDEYLSELFDWYSGDELNLREVRETADGTQENALVWPLQINYAEVVVDKLAQLVWGQWHTTQSRHVITPMVRAKGRYKGKEVWDGLAQSCEEYISECLFVDNDGDKLLRQAGIDCGVYGAAIIQIGYDPIAETVPLSVIPPEFFKCRWNYAGKIVDAIVMQHILVEEAIAQGWALNETWASQVKKGYRNEDVVTRWEYWSVREHNVWIEDQLIEKKGNPLGAVPFFVIPNRSTSGTFYGKSDIDGIRSLVLELNSILADAGDAHNYFAHPIPVLIDTQEGVDDLNTGPGQAWQVTTRHRSENQAIVKYLMWDGPSPDFVAFFKLVQAVLHDVSYVPQVAYGVPQGTQQSGVALQVEMMPATNLAAEKRIYWSAGLREMFRAILGVAARFGLLASPRSEYATSDNIARLSIDAGFAPMLPRDQTAEVNRNIALVNNRLSARRSALINLGNIDPEEELDEIYNDWRKDARIESPGPMQGEVKPQNPGEGQSSSDEPGGEDATDILQE
ncbi:MAG: phage portal protein [Chloroflexota bacterium]